MFSASQAMCVAKVSLIIGTCLSVWEGSNERCISDLVIYHL